MMLRNAARAPISSNSVSWITSGLPTIRTVRVLLLYDVIWRRFRSRKLFRVVPKLYRAPLQR